jgi:MFS superfamily sulfate permease-like transporter
LIHIREWKDLAILLGTATITIVFGAEVGILVCLAGSLFLIIRHSTFPTVTIRGRVPDSNKFRDLYVCNDLNLFDEKHNWFHEANQVSEKGKTSSLNKKKLLTHSFANLLTSHRHSCHSH